MPALAPRVFALGQVQYVETAPGRGSFPVFSKNIAAPSCVDTNDFAGVIRAAGELQSDVARVTGSTPKMLPGENELDKNIILIGTLGKN